MKVRVIALAAASGLLTTQVAAVQAPDHLLGSPALELKQGQVRVERELIWDHTPVAARSAFARLSRDMGQARAVWDRATGVPARIWGEGMPAPSAIDSPKAALAHAQRMLERHLGLLAPGASSGDFVLVSNDLDAGMRTIGFSQYHRGEPVVGGQLSFRFKNDRLFMIGSEALPAVDVHDAAPVSPATAIDAARAWLADVVDEANAVAVEGPMVLPLLEEHSVSYRRVLRVTVETQPLGRWHVYVDAHDAEAVAREQTLRFASGTVLYDAPVRRPGAQRQTYPAVLTSLTVDGAAVTSDASGGVTWNGNAAASVQVRASGDLVTVDNVAGGEVTATLSLPPGGSVTWLDEAEFSDAQITTFVHLNQVKTYAKSFAPDLPYLDELLQANVNINNSCNAFYDGSSVNFFRQAGNCGNTGRLADVAYHEFGHALHDAGIIEGVGFFDGALSEGLSDYLSVTITGDSGMGRGFFNSDEPLREANPPNFEHRWPDDIGEIHYTGLIIVGALWDMRQYLIDDIGQDAGVAAANHIFYQSLRRAVDIPTMYFEALAADDDDGDLGNGTPHLCAIIAGFEPHGLHHVSAQGGGKVAVAPPQLDAYRVSLGLVGAHYECDPDLDASAEVEWRLRDQADTGGTLAMQLGPTGFEADLPAVPDGSVVQYRVNLTLEGDTTLYPDNLADPWYEMFVGHVEPIYCTDFETDPFSEGWSHALDSGTEQEGADDWQWGMPQSPSDSGDPPHAFSGDNVIGNDLGAGNYNGLYQADKSNHVETPAIDVSGYDNVRLQYRRWLNVEDGAADRAAIVADGEVVWQNLAVGSPSAVNHLDREWRFQDVDISAQAADGSVVLEWNLTSDGGLELGGWTIDDVCVVAWIPTVCGDGKITGLEQCDDGASNAEAPDACRPDCTPAACGDGIVDSAESCDDGNLVDGDGCDAACAVEETVDPGSGGNAGGLGPGDGSCGCGVPPHHARHAWWALALGLVLWRRRRQG